MNDKRKTLNEWMIEIKVRPAIHNDEIYNDKSEYTYEEFLNKVPYEMQVPLFVETYVEQKKDNTFRTNGNELVAVQNGMILISEEFVNEYKKFAVLKAKMEMAEKEVKEQLKVIMKEMNKPTLILENMAITYKKSTTRTTLDSKKLKEDMPEIFEEYSKTSEVSDSISIKVEI